jgi:hypothetical protein
VHTVGCPGAGGFTVAAGAWQAADATRSRYRAEATREHDIVCRLATLSPTCVAGPEHFLEADAVGLGGALESGLL